MKRYICMILDGSYPQDIRVRKEAETLVINGFDVLIICPNRIGIPKKEMINGVSVHRIGTSYGSIKKGLNDIFESFFNINLFFYFHLRKVLNNQSLLALHVHDLPLASTVYRFKNKKIPLILDLHENYPEALKTWFSWRKSKWIRIKNRIFMNPEKWNKKEKKYVDRFDTVICVVEEMKMKLIHKFNVEPSKFIVVSNHEKTDFIVNYKKLVNQNLIIDNDYAITYVGGFGPHRGLDTVINAMPLILEKQPRVKLFLVGSGHPDVIYKLKKMVSEFNLEKAVIFGGHRPFQEVAAIMCASMINIIPHHSNDHTDNTIPHKLFQIMMTGRTLLVSSCKPLERIVNKYKAGYVFKAGDEHSFADKIDHIINNSLEANEKSENALNAVLHKGENWNSEGLKLVSYYKSIIS